MKNLNNGAIPTTNPETTTPFIDEAITELPFAQDDEFMDELVMGPDGFLVRRKWLLGEDHDAWSFRK